MSRKQKIEVSYGQTFDEKIIIESFSDELRFKTCMKLYKTHLTIEELERAITQEALIKIENSI